MAFTLSFHFPFLALSTGFKGTRVWMFDIPWYMEYAFELFGPLRCFILYSGVSCLLIANLLMVERVNRENNPNTQIVIHIYKCLFHSGTFYQNITVLFFFSVARRCAMKQVIQTNTSANSLEPTTLDPRLILFIILRYLVFHWFCVAIMKTETNNIFLAVQADWWHTL